MTWRMTLTSNETEYSINFIPINKEKGMEWVSKSQVKNHMVTSHKKKFNDKLFKLNFFYF